MPRPLTFKLDDVSVQYGGRVACVGLDLEIRPGEALAFVGPSGAGKTTALRLLNATVRPSAGRVEVDGADLAAVGDDALRALRARVGIIPQDLGLVPNLRVVQNVLAGRLGRHGFLRSVASMVRPRRAELTRVLEILDRLGIGDLLYERVDTLSGGERQRVAVARALYQEAGALLADEPLSALDPARSRETLELLLEVARENELTLVLSMHDIELARGHVPRLVGLRNGRVTFDRPAAEVAETDLLELYQLEGLAQERRGG